ncbi:MAG: hypothetical protein AB2L14_07835 [Candidatus Xenobiia bacterium LiM19]
MPVKPEGGAGPLVRYNFACKSLRMLLKIKVPENSPVLPATFPVCSVYRYRAAVDGKTIEVLLICGANQNGAHLHFTAFSDNYAPAKLLIEREVNLHGGCGQIGWKCEKARQNICNDAFQSYLP